MSSLSGRSPPWCVALGVVVSLASIAGAWGSAAREERAVRDANDAALARMAAAYLGVVTPPGPDGGVDAKRLVASANTLAGASFWPGGFQMALGSVALVADTIGLVPLAESAVRALARGDESVLTTQARTRVALVPASTLLGQTSPGWAAAWNTLPSVLASRYSAFLVLSLLLGVGAVVLVLRHRHVRVGRRRALFAAVVGYGLLMLGLGLSVRQAAKHSTAVRLRMARRLIEIAATASDVRQARLAEIAVSLDVRGLEPPVISTDTVVRSVSGGKPVARVTAATPRTRGGLEIGMTPIEAGLGRLYVALLLWFGLGAAGLIGGASAAGLSASGGLFHSTGPDAERTPQEGRTPE